MYKFAVMMPTSGEYGRLDEGSPHQQRDNFAALKTARLILTGIIIGAAATLLIAVAPARTYAVGRVNLDSSGKKHKQTSCQKDPDYSTHTLKTVIDVSLQSMVPYADMDRVTKFEASDVVWADHYNYVICDSSWNIMRVHESLPILSNQNSLIYPEGRALDAIVKNREDSGFEAIVKNQQQNNSWFVVRESVDLSTGVPNAIANDFHSIIMEIRITEPESTEAKASYHIVEVCPGSTKFDGLSKGFEGAVSIIGKDGVQYLLGLCEGNFCKDGKQGKSPGNGRVVVMKYRPVGGPDNDGDSDGDADGDSDHDGDGHDGCMWKAVAVLEIPESAYFLDYSSIALHHLSQTVAISSQENGQIWVGQLHGGSNGEFDPQTAHFKSGAVYDFPWTSNCERQYCNVEGIHWQWGGVPGDPKMLVAVSDKMKKKGKQSFTCQDKDQSLHMFTLP